MQIIHPYRHNAVIVCIFIPFDWQTATASEFCSGKENHQAKNTQSGLMVVFSMELWRYRNFRLDTVPVPMKVPAYPTAPSYSLYPKKQMSWPSLQMKRVQFTLVNPLTRLRRQRLYKMVHRTRDWKLPSCKKLWAIPLQYLQKYSSPAWQGLQTNLRQLNNEKSFLSLVTAK